MYSWSVLKCAVSARCIGVSDSYSEQCERLTWGFKKAVSKSSTGHRGRGGIPQQRQGLSSSTIQRSCRRQQRTVYSLPWEKNRSAAELNICGSVHTMWRCEVIIERTLWWTLCRQIWLTLIIVKHKTCVICEFSEMWRL